MTRMMAAALITVACILPGEPADAQVAQQPRDTTYVVITRGLLGTPILPLRFESVPLDVGVRNLVVGPGETQAVPISVRSIMELRGGMIITTIDGQRQERRQGDFWVVEPGSSISLVNRGDVAVIRVLQLQERR